MEIEIIYPPRNARKIKRYEIINWVKWPFLLAACICPIVNISTGGPAWSIIVLWSLWIVWSFSFSPELVELNRISLLVKSITNVSLLLILIDVFLSPGWAVVAVPIVCFAGLAVTGVLFFTDINKQKQNMMPMLMLIIASIIASVSGIIIWGDHAGRWTLIVMGAMAAVLLVAIAWVLGSDFIREIKRRFHTK